MHTTSLKIKLIIVFKILKLKTTSLAGLDKI